MYRVGWIGWKALARAGVSMLIKLEVARDEEAGVFICTSPDLPGLVVEASTLEELHREVVGCVDMLMEDELHQPLKHKPLTAWPGDFALA